MINPAMLRLLLSLIVVTYCGPVYAAEFHVLEIHQAQVDALKMQGKRTASSNAQILSPDGIFVAGTTAGVPWLWSADQSFNYPYYNVKYRISSIANRGVRVLLHNNSVDTKIRGIDARHTIVIDETQSSGKTSSRQLKPMERLVQGKRFYLKHPSNRSSTSNIGPLRALGVQARTLSADGSWVVGAVVHEKDGARRTDAYRWHAVTGYEIIPRPLGWPNSAEMAATAISDDGSVVVGLVRDQARLEPPLHNSHRPFRWRQGDAHSQVLEHVFPDQPFPQTRATHISGDGKTVVGLAVKQVPRKDGKHDEFATLFTWREATGYDLLEQGGDSMRSGRARGVSRDGQVIVGSINVYPDDYDGSMRERRRFRRHGAVWRNGNMHTANDFFSQQDLDFPQGTLTAVNAVSADGQVFVGAGVRDGNHVGYGWLASLRAAGVTVVAPPAPAASPKPEQQASLAPLSKPKHKALSNTKPEPSTKTAPELLPPAHPPQAQPAVSQAPPAWEVMGYWNYDGIDGALLPAGLQALAKSGQSVGQQWHLQLQMVKHSALPVRQRELWPVYLSRAKRLVCAPYPGYPTYQAHIDLPGEQYDGTYQFASCGPD